MSRRFRWSIALLALFVSVNADARGRTLAVPYHQQTTVVWCWAASIAMVAEFFRKQPVSDCDVADRLDRANGGSGACCIQGRPSNRACVYGRRDGAMTEVMKWYFQLDPTEFHRALTWSELTASIDAGYPLIAKLYVGGSTAHAVVITGYQGTDTVLVADPWKDAPNRAAPRSYKQMIDRRLRPVWVSTWYLRADEVSGHFSGASDRPANHAEVAATPAGPALSTVVAHFAEALELSVRQHVDKQLDKRLPAVRSCYDTGLTGKALANPATVRLSFAVEKGNPAWIMLKNAGGLPPQVTGCVSEAVSKWKGLFPASGQYAESQTMDLVFAPLQGTVEAAK